MQINVKQEHIDNGIPKDPDYCPIALSMQDMGLLKPIASGISLLWYDDDGKYHRAFPPYTAYRWMLAFDAGEEVEPFSFEALETGA